MFGTDYRLPLTTENGIIFSTVGIRQSPLISKCWKSVFFFILEKGQNIGRGPKFQDPTTSNVGDYFGESITGFF